ncbi:MAG: efflux RND transporter permease subunit, partial [Hydrogenophaga sp.]
MNALARFFIRRPIGSVMLAVGIVLVGLLAWRLLPVSPLPRVDFPVIQVRASLPGASPESMASTVAAPLERALGSIAGVASIRSSSNQGSTSVTLQFNLDRDIDEAAREVQADTELRVVMDRSPGIRATLREAQFTLVAAMLISLAVSVTLTPALCAHGLPAGPPKPPGPLARGIASLLADVQAGYARSLGFALRHRVLTLLLLAGTVALNVWLYVAIPKGML